MFNALKYTRRLEQAGFTKDQAETSMDILLEVMTENLSTKQDMQMLRQDMLSLEERIGFKIDKLEARMTIKLGAMLAASITIVVTLIKIL